MAGAGADDMFRCDASAQVAPGVWKRCQMARLHAGWHTWAESWARTSGAPLLVRWATERQARPLAAPVMVPRPIPDPPRRIPAVPA